MVVKEVLRSQNHFKSDFFIEVLGFFKSEEREACQDKANIVWCRSKEAMYRQSREESQKLKKKGLAMFCLESAEYINKEIRQLTFEDYQELETHHDYLNDEIRRIASKVTKTVNEWDRRKEEFLRRRILCFLSEEKKEGNRQNTQYF